MLKKYSLFILICCLLLTAAGCTENHALKNEAVQSDGTMEVHFLDVGQGDSTLIKTPKENILIDGGEVDQGDIIVDYLKQQQVAELDILISTHPHSDHIGGLQNVLSQIPVKLIIDPVVAQSKSGLYSGYKKVIAAKKIELRPAKAGDVYKITGGDLKIVYCDNRAEEINNTSIVTLINYGKSKVLFTGDLEKDREVKINEQADLLQVGHHGSRTSSCEKFLQVVKPHFAVISCGQDNEYGHPHSEVLERLHNLGIEIYRTDEAGDIIFTTNGEKWQVRKGQSIPDVQVSQDNKYIGNKQSKIYHLANCNNKPKAENQIVLSSREEAAQKGYKPHKCIKK